MCCAADQKIVYNAVLAAVTAVLDAMKPGVSWVDMHALAYRNILTHLRDGGEWPDESVAACAQWLAHLSSLLALVAHNSWVRPSLLLLLQVC